MAKIIVQTDDGQEVSRYTFGEESSYALTHMPSCPVNMHVHNLLMALKHDIDDACWIDRTGNRRPERPSEKVMRIISSRRIAHDSDSAA